MIYRLLGGCAVFEVMYFVLKKAENGMLKKEEGLTGFEKVMLAVMVSLAFLNAFLPDLWGGKFLENQEWLYEVHDPVFSAARLISAAMIVTIPVALAYKRKTFSRFAVFFGIISFFANLLLAGKYMYYYTNPEFCPLTELSRAFTTNIYFRAAYFAVFELVKLLLVIRIMIKRREDLRFESVSDVLKFALFSIPLLFVNMPPVFPSQLTGSFCGSITLKSCNITDIVWILVIAALIVGLTLIFRKREYEDRYILLIVLSMSLIFQYAAFYQTCDLTMVVRLPFQLCNFACFFLPFAILTKRRSLLCFASIANVIGAVAAVIICDTPGGDGLFYALNVHYMIEHTGIIVIGFLLLTLGIITPLRKSDVISMWKIFNVYFIVVLILGTVFNAIHVAHNYEPVIVSTSPLVTIDFHCNYLFMFLEDVAVDLVPAFAVLYQTYLPIGNYARLQLSEIAMYITFLIVCIGPFFIFYAIFREKKNPEHASPEREK